MMSPSRDDHDDQDDKVVGALRASLKETGRLREHIRRLAEASKEPIASPLCARS